MPPRPALHRIIARPTLDQWGDDELISMREAVALFFANGPLDADALRFAIRRGELAATFVCGRTFTTPGAVRLFIAPKRKD